MKKQNIIIIHGTGGSPNGNWFQWAAKELQSRGHNVIVPRMPTPENQSADNWHRALADAVGEIGPGTILIGHSCGATFLLHVLENLEHPITQSIFISGFIDILGNEFFDNLNRTFVEHDFDWTRIRANAGQINILHGDNDPYVPLPAAERLANGLQTPITVIPNGGHLNSDAGYTEFPQILGIIE